MSTMKTTTTREVTDEEIASLIHGTGALSWEWWRAVDAEERGGVTGYLFEVENPNGAGTLNKWVSVQDIATAAGDYLSERVSHGPLGGDERDALDEDLGYLDASGADIVLQRAVLGAVTFG